jgi:hypothetical protein
MIPVNQNIVNSSSGIDMQVGFTAKSENLGVLFHILRSQLYKDPIMAVIREYAVNAGDANIMAGKPNEPIKISLPVLLDCFFKVRDFGNGLSDEEIQDVFASYGESTKRKTQDATGMLGIGCKSGFAYNDSFIVNSYQNGKMTAWNAYIDPSNQGKMAKMATDDTDEPNGIEIVIPVKVEDIANFTSKAIHLFSFFKVEPIIENLSVTNRNALTALRNKAAMYEGKNWKFFGDHSQSYATMGNIPYPIDSVVFGSDIKPEIRELLTCGIVLNFNIGELEFAASREALQYTPTTKRAILNALDNVYKDLLAQIDVHFKGCRSLWEAKVLYHETYDNMYGSLYKIRNLIKNKISFNGAAITNNYFVTDMVGYGGQSDDVRNSCYQKNVAYARNGRVGRMMENRIMATNKHLVVVNDKNILNGIINRVIGLIEGGKYSHVYVLNFKDANAMALWLKTTSFDGDMVKLSTLAKEPLSKYYPDVAIVGATGFTNIKHGLSEFEIKFPIGNNRYGCPNSDYWTSVTVDPSNDAGVYLPIERFEFKSGRGYGWEHPSAISSYINALQKLDIQPPKIYGFKPSSVTKAKLNPKMVLFWDWAKTEATNRFINDPVLSQKYVDRLYNAASLNQNSAIENLVHGTELIKHLSPSSPMHKFITEARSIISLNNNANDLDVKREACSILTGVHNLTNLTVSKDLKPDIENIKTRYPLLVQYFSSSSYHTGMIKSWADYVLMVDMLTP